MDNNDFQEAECWPNSNQRLLLQAALLKGAQALEAWSQWQQRVDFEQADDGSYRLFPLVYRNLIDLGVAPDRTLERFKGVYRLTWSHNNFLFHHTAKALKQLAAKNIDLMLLKGAPLSLLYYRDRGLRPMSDLDVMVHPGDRDSAIEILMKCGYRPLQPLKPQRLNITHSHEFKDSDGFTIDLHWFLIQEACNPKLQQGWWQRAQSMDFHSIKTFYLDDTDQLLHTLAHGCRWNPMPPFRWIADATAIIKTGGINWASLFSQAEALKIGLTIRESLCFIDSIFPGLVPAEALRDLQKISISRRERREFSVKANRFSVRRRIIFHWYNYQRVSEYLPRDANPGFLGYLRQRWQIDGLWQLLDVIYDKLKKERARSSKNQF